MRNVLYTPPRPAQSRSIEEEIESRVCIPLQTPIIWPQAQEAQDAEVGVHDEAQQTPRYRRRVI